jgi:hypothetical protein
VVIPKPLDSILVPPGSAGPGSDAETTVARKTGAQTNLEHRYGDIAALAATPPPRVCSALQMRAELGDAGVVPSVA